MTDYKPNTLLSNRQELTGRGSIEALIAFARLLLSNLEIRTKKYIRGKNDSAMEKH